MSSVHNPALSGSPTRVTVPSAVLGAVAASAPTSTAPRKARPEEFIFGKLIGEGSFACVFLAKEVSTGREFAIKVCEKRMIIRENKTEYIHREKAIMLLLSEYNEKRPYFVQLHSTFQDASRLYFVITYAKNGDLLRLINRLSTNSEETTSRATECARFYAGELVAAVEYLHEKGIIHRDLKPENILLNEKLHILITDFGSAKLVRTDGKRSNSARRRRRTGDNREGDHDSEADTSGDNYTSDDANEPPVPKRKSFVGTPQYVSPEILTSRGSSRASDLWAIGCIIYQLMTGLPPFQSQSEFLIFKKIEKLDYSFHEGFNEDAKDLVQKLLVIEPQDRLGAKDEEYYTSIRRHPFFNGLDFERLPEMVAPSVGMLPAAHEGPDPVWKRLDDAKPGADRIPLLMVEDGDTSGGDDEGIDFGLDLEAAMGNRLSPGNGGHSQRRSNSRRNRATIEHLSVEERKSRLAEQAKNNEYHRFTEGNLIVKQGILYKKKGFFPKKRMFLLTEGPHLYYVDPDKMVLKGKIPWSSVLRTEVRNFRIFFVHVPGRTYYLIDHESRAKDWCDAIDDVKKFYYDVTHEDQ